MAAAPALTIRPGRNVWLFARTDRDAPTPATAAQTGAAYANRLLTGETILPVSSPRGPAGVQRYYLGAARPTDVTAHTARPALPEPALGPPATPNPPPWRWRQEDQPEPFAIQASKPWYVLVDFDWRGPVTDLATWPHRAVNFFGLPTERNTELDWLLLEARHLGPATRPDSDWSGDVIETVKEGAKDVADHALGLTQLALIVGAIVLFGGGRRRD